VDGVHDLGGMHGFGPVVEPGGDDVFHEAWEPRIFALHLLVSSERLGAGPGGRATREEMPPADYLAAGYYDRWLWSAERRLERAGTIAPGDVEAMMARLEAGESAPERSDPAIVERGMALVEHVAPMAPAAAARFAPGDRVRVRRLHPEGHTRCPRYARGVAGTVTHVRGSDRLPDRATYGQPAEPEPVYAVAFRSDDLWGPQEGEPAFTVLLDLWDSYLDAEATA
jgi:nitrile hydratase